MRAGRFPDVLASSLFGATTERYAESLKPEPGSYGPERGCSKPRRLEWISSLALATGTLLLRQIQPRLGASNHLSSFRWASRKSRGCRCLRAAQCLVVMPRQRDRQRWATWRDLYGEKGRPSSFRAAAPAGGAARPRLLTWTLRITSSRSGYLHVTHPRDEASLKVLALEPRGGLRLPECQ